MARWIGCLLLLHTLIAPHESAAAITEIIDSTGDGIGNRLDDVGQNGVAVDSSGNVYVTGFDNAFKITPAGTITEIIDSNGDGGLDNYLAQAHGIGVDSSGNVYVAGGSLWDNVFRIATPGSCSTSGTPCTITEIMDSTGSGPGNSLATPYSFAFDSSDNVYVAAFTSSNVYRIATPGTCSTSGTPCTITQIITSGGVGSGHRLTGALDIAVDSSGNVYVGGDFTHNAFRIATPGSCNTSGTPCTVTEIIDSTGDGNGNTLAGTFGVAVDSSGNVYVTGIHSRNTFKIATPGTCSTTGTPCTITEIIDSTGDGNGNFLDFPYDVAVDSSDNVHVVGESTHNAFRIDTPGTCSTSGTPCTITEIIDLTGDHSWNTLLNPNAVALDSNDDVYVGGDVSRNVFKITPAECGDGFIEATEQCDDSDSTPGDGCDASCQIEAGYFCTGEPSGCSFCGDGLIEGTEQCDDSDTTPGDGCDASCQIEAGYFCTGEPSGCTFCGDGLIEGTEQCDDNGTTPGDGCDASCQIEFGYSCTDEPSVCDVICGDGLTAGAETCDDGGTTPGDGCDGVCQIEAGYSCTGEPIGCSFCGDGLIEGAEQCDDGDTTSGDGCDDSCQNEPGFSCVNEPSVCFSVTTPALRGPWAVLLGICLLGIGAHWVTKPRVRGETS